MQTELQNKWQQVMARDARQDGRFVFAVRTTGIYCRPSCPAGGLAGNRWSSLPVPMKPNAPDIVPACVASRLKFPRKRMYVMRARQLLDHAEGMVTLNDLSKRVGLSPFHLQRLFKRATGLSPREYQSARRMQHVKTGLRKGEDVTTALYDAGFGSPSRLYEKAPQQLGMTPGEYRRGGAGANITLCDCAHSAGPAADCGDGARTVRRALRDKSAELEQRLAQGVPCGGLASR